MLKFIAAVIAAAAIAGVFTFQSAASARTEAVAPVAAVTEAAPQDCTPQPWPYLTCAGASSVRLVTADRATR